MTIYDHPDDQRYIRASELNFNHPPDDLITRGKYQVVIHLDVGLTSPEARFIIRMRLGNKGYGLSSVLTYVQTDETTSNIVDRSLKFDRLKT